MKLPDTSLTAEYQCYWCLPKKTNRIFFIKLLHSFKNPAPSSSIKNQLTEHEVFPMLRSDYTDEIQTYEDQGPQD